jgi:hypothetical protein
MAESTRSQSFALGLLGAASGGILGYVAFGWLIGQGFYALVLPPALIGLAAGMCVKHRSTVLAGICSAAGLLLGLFLEWKFFPFTANASLSYFLAHLHQLRALTWIMILIGVCVSYSFALKRNPAPDARPTS